MSCLFYRDRELYIENVSLKNIAADFGTPCYIYSRAAIESNWYTFNQAFSSLPHRICYAVKANGNLSILNLLARLKSGFDIVSLGELERVVKAGGDAANIIFSGVGKSQFEIESAIKHNIGCFDVESEAELHRLQACANKLGKQINIALRINPNINPQTHAHISTGLKENKFGIDIEDLIPLCLRLSQFPALKLIGIACHIGSQITRLAPFMLAMDCLLEQYKQLGELGITIRHINIGGGLGVIYRNEQPPSIHDYAAAIAAKMAHTGLELIIEPGRAIVANAGALLTKVEYLKHSAHINFAIVDAGMNDLLRPALYDAWQDILPVTVRDAPPKLYDVAGPVCESADFLGKDRSLAIQADDLLVVDCVGAYGFSMSSNYNARCRLPEVLVDGNTTHLIRRRETIEDLFSHEKLLEQVLL